MVNYNYGASFPLCRTSLGNFAPFLYSDFSGHFLTLNLFSLSPLTLFCEVQKLVRIETSCDSLEFKKCKGFRWQSEYIPGTNLQQYPRFYIPPFFLCPFFFLWWEEGKERRILANKERFWGVTPSLRCIHLAFQLMQLQCGCVSFGTTKFTASHCLFSVCEAKADTIRQSVSYQTEVCLLSVLAALRGN